MKKPLKPLSPEEEKRLLDPARTEKLGKAVDQFVDKGLKDVREGYDRVTTDLGKTVDEGAKSLKQFLQSAGATPEKVPTDTFEIVDEPRKLENFSTAKGGPKLKEYTYKKDTTASAISEPFANAIPDTSTVGSKTLVRPDEIIEPSKLVDMDEESILKIVNQQELDYKTKNDLVKTLLKKRAQMRMLKGKEMQDRGVFQFMIDEARKKEQGK